MPPAIYKNAHFLRSQPSRRPFEREEDQIRIADNSPTERDQSLAPMEELLVRRGSICKRAIDIVGSTAGLTVAFPVMLVVAVAVKLTSTGPALFRQKRLGRLGKEFTCLKFRSMYADGNLDIHKKYMEQFIKGSDLEKGYGKIKDDPRITPLGKFLRKTSLDELPQLINVLKGEMSLVGPRPPLPYECAHYGAWHRRRVLDMKPGITGLWQVTSRSRSTFDEMVRLDLKYMREWSLWLDLKILIQTPRAVLSGKGAS